MAVLVFLGAGALIGCSNGSSGSPGGGGGSPAAAPSFSPGSQSFVIPVSVTMADPTPGATIHYTLDGSTPTAASAAYSGPISITGTTTVQAIATAPNFSPSNVVAASYTHVAAARPASDNFDENSLNTTLWTVENPSNDGVVTMNGSAMTLNLPQAAVHDPAASTGNQALRVVQTLPNADFGVEVRLQSGALLGGQEEGIVVEQDQTTSLRLGVRNDGTQVRLTAAGVSSGTASSLVDTPVAVQAPVWLRLWRSGASWTASWSSDGTNYTAEPAFNFTMNVAGVGPYAANTPGPDGTTPAITATVDYLFQLGDPVANNDGPTPYSVVTVDANPGTALVEKTLADIRGSGHLNPVIGLELPSNGGIYWYDYPATGGISGQWTKHTIVGSGDAYEDIQPLDVNGDGAVDVIASYDPTDTGNYSLVWFQNPRGSGGDPAVDTWTQHVIGASQGESNMVLADIDGDGKMDIVTPSYIFFQDSPTSWTKVQYNNSFRGDGLLDIGSGKGAINLVGTGPAAPYNAVWFENPRETGGNARTGTWTMHTIGPGYPCLKASECSDGNDVAIYSAADLNGDGQMDVIMSQSEGPNGSAPPPGGLIWYEAPADRRNGAWVPHVIDASFVDAHQVSIADMDRNGTLDLITTEQDQSPLRRVAVFYNDGKGNFTEQVLSNVEGHDQVVGNITGTGGMDILNSGHGFWGASHPLQIFVNPYHP